MLGLVRFAVLGLTALGNDVAGAREKAYAAVEKVEFAGAQYRRDIGIKGAGALSV